MEPKCKGVNAEENKNMKLCTGQIDARTLIELWHEGRCYEPCSQDIGVFGAALRRLKMCHMRYSKMASRSQTRNNGSCYRAGRRKLFLGKHPKPPSLAWSISKQPELVKSQAAHGNKMVSWTPGYKIAWQSFPTWQVGTCQSLKNMSQGLISRCRAVQGFLQLPWFV